MVYYAILTSKNLRNNPSNLLLLSLYLSPFSACWSSLLIDIKPSAIFTADWVFTYIRKIELFEFILKGVLQGAVDEQNSPQPRSFPVKSRMRGNRPSSLSVRPRCLQIVNFLPSWLLECHKISYSYTVCEGGIISTHFYDKDFSEMSSKRWAEVCQIDSNWSMSMLL